MRAMPCAKEKSNARLVAVALKKPGSMSCFARVSAKFLSSPKPSRYGPLEPLGRAHRFPSPKTVPYRLDTKHRWNEAWRPIADDRVNSTLLVKYL